MSTTVNVFDVMQQEEIRCCLRANDRVVWVRPEDALSVIRSAPFSPYYAPGAPEAIGFLFFPYESFLVVVLGPEEMSSRGLSYTSAEGLAMLLARRS